MTLTRKQREALKRTFDRCPLYTHPKFGGVNSAGVVCPGDGWRLMSYREFRGEVKMGYGCIMVDWCGMTLGIEPDGYTHS